MNTTSKLGIVAHVYKLSTHEAKENLPMCSGPAWPTYWVTNQSRLQSENLAKAQITKQSCLIISNRIDIHEVRVWDQVLYLSTTPECNKKSSHLSHLPELSGSFREERKKINFPYSSLSMLYQRLTAF